VPDRVLRVLVDVRVVVELAVVVFELVVEGAPHATPRVGTRALARALAWADASAALLECARFIAPPAPARPATAREVDEGVLDFLPRFLAPERAAIAREVQKAVLLLASA
jgi:hypothetical protein